MCCIYTSRYIEHDVEHSDQNGTISLRWERPTWDTRNIVTQVKINCSASDYVIIAEISITIILAGLTLNTTVTFCHTLVISMSETGPQKCVKYPSQRITTEGKLNCYVYVCCFHDQQHDC